MSTAPGNSWRRRTLLRNRIRCVHQKYANAASPVPVDSTATSLAPEISHRWVALLIHSPNANRAEVITAQTRCRHALRQSAWGSRQIRSKVRCMVADKPVAKTNAIRKPTTNDPIVSCLLGRNNCVSSFSASP